MKNLFLSILIVGPALGLAQPSNSSVTALIRKNHPHASTIKLGSESRSKEYVEGKWINYYKRSYVATFKSDELPDITMLFNGSVQYIVNGSSYNFDSFLIGQTEFDGVPNPNEKEVTQMLNSNLDEYLRFEYANIIGDISEITFPSDVKFKYKDLNHVSFETLVTYTSKISPTEIEKATHTFETHLYRDNYDLPWAGFRAFEDESKRKVISIKTVTPSEMKNYKTLPEIDEENKANKMISSLPSVDEAPVFKSDKQLFYYVHHFLMVNPPQEAKAHLFKVIDPSNFETGNILLQRSEDWVNNIINNLSKYQNSFCEYPIIKDEQYGMIYFYNKDKSKFARMTASEMDGTWKLKLIEFYPPSDDDVNRLSKISGNCGEKPDLEIKEVIKYEIGDKVDVSLSHGMYQGEIVKKDASFDNRYFVKVSDGRSYWLTDDKLAPSTGKNTSQSSTNSSNTHQTQTNSSNSDTPSFQIGDKVSVRTSSGDMKGKIIKEANGKFLVKLMDPRYQDMWVSPSNLVK